jgi:hypothetical protein
MKKLLMASIILAGMVGSASADPQTIINNIKSVPGKLHNHIQMEIEKTKEYQSKNWAKMKEDFLKIKAKFIKN